MASALETFLAAAIQAPSGDNTQPWRFRIDIEAFRIDLLLDETRDPSPMNSGQRMARIALGAALENICRTARLNRWDDEIRPGEGPAVATVRLSCKDPASIQVDKAIQERVTNRRYYDRRPISEEVLHCLHKETPDLNGVRTLWITDQALLPKFAEIIGQADLLMFGEPAMRQAFLGNIRFDAPANAPVDEGLSLASLELSWFEHHALSVMARIPDWILKKGGGLGPFKRKAQKLIMSASGLCVICAENEDAYTDIQVGQTVQKAWLSLTERGLACQPMMSLPVLENAVLHGSSGNFRFLRPDQVEELTTSFHRLAPEIGDHRIAFILRFGYSAGPTGRTGRKPLGFVVDRLR